MGVEGRVRKWRGYNDIILGYTWHFIKRFFKQLSLTPGPIPGEEAQSCSAGIFLFTCDTLIKKGRRLCITNCPNESTESNTCEMTMRVWLISMFEPDGQPSLKWFQMWSGSSCCSGKIQLPKWPVFGWIRSLMLLKCCRKFLEVRWNVWSSLIRQRGGMVISILCGILPLLQRESARTCYKERLSPWIYKITMVQRHFSRRGISVVR